ncbi:MAG: hypothetical protein CL923_07115 [Deltaproteobacteria bacterium]|nr:hypothetical protein [Deltaproteobacteria bacterium]
MRASRVALNFELLFKLNIFLLANGCSRLRIALKPAFIPESTLSTMLLMILSILTFPIQELKKQQSP